MTLSSAGSGKTAATMACVARSSFSLTSCVQPPVIAAARLSDREPYAYLKDVLERMTNGHPASRLDDLLPWNRKPSAG